MDRRNNHKIPNSRLMFPELDADTLVPEITEIESLCMRCGENGTTKLLLTKIPFYKEVVVMSFSCDHCHWRNNELQPASVIQERGILFKLKVSVAKDLGRQLVKTEWASILIPEIDFEIPQHSQEGTVTTIEGILLRAYDGIQDRLKDIKARDPESAQKLLAFLEQMKELIEAKTGFTFILRDISGNSFVENLCAPHQDPAMEVTHFARSNEEAIMLGIVPHNEEQEDGKDETKTKEAEDDDLKNEVLEFPTNCPNCHAPCFTNMKLTHIPLFKDVVIMATVCETCGHRTNEVKSGAGIEPHGVKYTLKIKTEKDFSRDLIKSDTCHISIPELELEVGPTTFSGCYTTVEGLITNIKNQLVEDNPFYVGDSAQSELKDKMTNFLERLSKAIDGSEPFTLILDDPCGNSYVQSMDYPETDSNLTVEKYERTFEQNEELGLNDMKVENYEEV